MNLAQTNLSKLKACGKSAGGKAPLLRSRRPRLIGHFIPALKGPRNRAFALSSAPSRRKYGGDDYLGYRCAQPQADFRPPFRLRRAERELSQLAAGPRACVLRIEDNPRSTNWDLGTTRAPRVSGGRLVRQPDGVAGRTIRFVHAHRGGSTRGASNRTRGGCAPPKYKQFSHRGRGGNLIK